MGMPRRWMVVKSGLFILALVPAVGLILGAFTGGLGVNPIETVTRTTGDWALRLLLVTLAVTPLRHLTGWSRLMGLRRMLGLYAFFYASLHLLSYVLLDQFLDWSAIAADIAKRPYITVGVVTYSMLLPLAVTSTRSMQRRLGGRHWQRLHRLAYIAAALGVVHFFLLVKADPREPFIYAGALLLLLGFRLVRHGTKRYSDGGLRTPLDPG